MDQPLHRRPPREEPDDRMRRVRALIDDRAEDGAFHVDRKVFTDREIFELEMAHIFEGTWVYIGLESQIPNPHDYVTTHIGRQPVVLSRDGEGRLACFFNSCRHRGAVVCPYRKGNAKRHVCRYHAWTYDSGGKAVGVAQAEHGQYPAGFDRSHAGLQPVPRLESYRGFVFASLSPDVPPLAEHLGEAAKFLDLVVDQSPKGVEYVPGEVVYTYDGNWKLQVENGLDYYHFLSTHASYVEVMRGREQSGAVGTPKTYEAADVCEAAGSYSFENGHALMYAVRKQGRVHVRPIAHDQAGLDEIAARVGENDLKWMLRQRNLTIYPNLQIVDVSSMQLRTWRPLAPGKTEIRSHCLAPVGESPAAREMRIRHYEDFFNPTGLGSSDDTLMYEYIQSGYEAEDAGETLGYLRGLGDPIVADDPFHGELPIRPTRWAYGPISFGDETCFHPGYRTWLRLILAGLEKDAAKEPAHV